jgi:hypothetical protein
MSQLSTCASDEREGGGAATASLFLLGRLTVCTPREG